MTNEQIKKDFIKFLETGCDYSDEMRVRDMKVIRKSELASLACLFAAGVLVGLFLAVVFGV